MKIFLILMLSFVLTSCKDSWEVKGQKIYDSMVDKIIRADADGIIYITLNNKYSGVMGQVVNEVAIPDGWEPVGGQSTYSYGRDGDLSTSQQSLKKVDKNQYLIRNSEGKLKIRLHSKVYK